MTSEVTGLNATRVQVKRSYFNFFCMNRKLNLTKEGRMSRAWGRGQGDNLKLI